jgi:hypothetical protein
MRRYVKIDIDQASLLLDNPEILKLWVLCHFLAQHQAYEVPLYGTDKVLFLEPGQFLTTARKLHETYYINSENNRKSSRTIWRWMKRLARAGFLTYVNVTGDVTGATVVTVANSYENTPPPPRACHDFCHINKEYIYNSSSSSYSSSSKNKKIQKNYSVNSNQGSSCRSRFDYPESYKSFASEFRDMVKAKYGKRAPKPTDLNRDVETIDKLIRLDGFELPEIKQVLLWAINDDFWGPNALSIARLRKKSKSNNLTKFQNIYTAYLSKRNESCKETVSDEPDYFEMGWQAARDGRNTPPSASHKRIAEWKDGWSHYHAQQKLTERT